MSAPGRFLAALVLGVIVACRATAPWALAAEDAAQPAETPLTNEDVVRMVASGASENEVREAIRSRKEAFELTDEMVDELKLAGVSAAIVAAMRQKHAESAPPPVPASAPARGRVPVVVSLNAGGGGARTIRVPAWADEDAKAKFQLPKEKDQREVKDLAIFLACVTPEHVPDLWRSKSPLGRDLTMVTRHELLAFVAGDTPAGTAPRLTLPDRIEAEVDEDEPHDLALGVAARIGDRWVQLGATILRKATIAASAKPLRGRIEHAGRGFEFKVELSAPR